MYQNHLENLFQHKFCCSEQGVKISKAEDQEEVQREGGSQVPSVYTVSGLTGKEIVWGCHLVSITLHVFVIT